MKDTKQQAADALLKAAERIGANNHAAAWKAATPAQRRDCLAGKIAVYHPTPEHITVIKAVPAVLSGKMSPDDAMNLLRQYNVEKQRGL